MTNGERLMKQKKPTPRGRGRKVRRIGLGFQPRLPPQLPASASALGWAEAWRGPCVHWIATDERGELSRVKITDPSFLNWPGLVHAVPGNIIPDFPVINKSFNLSYSGNDR